MKTLVLRLKNDINGNPKFCVKFNYMTDINRKSFRKVKDGFNFSTYESLNQYLSKHVERFEESELVVVYKKKDFHF